MRAVFLGAWLGCYSFVQKEVGNDVSCPARMVGSGRYRRADGMGSVGLVVQPPSQGRTIICMRLTRRWLCLGVS